ncbi:MAG: YcbK family protein [Aquificaceae bacterium]
MTRRKLLKYLGYMGFSLFASPLSYAFRENIRYLNMYSLNTGERIKTLYWMEGNYIESSLAEINHFLRDYRSGEIANIDVNLLDLLYIITRLSGKEEIVVISGYRSPKTNDYLYKTKKGVAKDSYHTLGKAIDIRIEGMSLKALRDLALGLKAGGVGYYPRSGFVHLDTGPFRYW